MSDDKALAEREETGVAAYDPEAFAGKGFDNQTMDDIVIPLIDIIQSNSPQIKPNHEKEIEGAKQGQLFSPTMAELIGDELLIIPVIYTRAYVEWRHRDHGGGYISSHDPQSQFVKEAIAANDGNRFCKIPVPSNAQNQLVETVYLHVLTPTLDTPYAVLPITSKKFGPFKKFNTKYTSVLVPRANGNGKYNPPLWQNKVMLFPKADSNAKGDFFVFGFKPADGDIEKSRMEASDPLFADGVKLYEFVTSGLIKAAQGDEEQHSDDGADGSGAF